MKESFEKRQLIVRLQALRKTIEREVAEAGGQGLGDDHACLLIDICEAVLDLTDAETFEVVGERYLAISQARQMWPAVSVVESLLGKEDPVDMTGVDVPAFLLNGRGPVDAEALRGFVAQVRNGQ